MPGVECFDLNLNAEVGHTLRHIAQHAGRIGHHIVRFGKVHGPAVERRNLGSADFKMLDTLSRRHHVSPRLLQGQRCLGWAKDNISTHARCQINHHIGIRRTNTLNHFFVQVNIARWGARLRVTHMTMNNRRTCLCCIDGVIGYLLGAARHFVTPVLCTSGARQCSGDKNFFTHG